MIYMTIVFFLESSQDEAQYNYNIITMSMMKKEKLQIILVLNSSL